MLCAMSQPLTIEDGFHDFRIVRSSKMSFSFIFRLEYNQRLYEQQAHSKKGYISMCWKYCRWQNIPQKLIVSFTASLSVLQSETIHFFTKKKNTFVIYNWILHLKPDILRSVHKYVNKSLSSYLSAYFCFSVC